jgi:Lon protease-like protein
MMSTTPLPPDPFIVTLARLPLFPLPNVVLFPNALLPLHIFEDRYRVMVRDLLAGERHLVMGFIQPDARDDDPRPLVAPIAGVGEVVMAHELPDGRFNLIVRGRVRVRIDRELDSDRPYRLVAASALPDTVAGDANELRDAEQALRALLEQLADAIPDGSEPLREVVGAAQTPTELADVIASELIPNAALRQQLLETLDVGKRIERIAAEVVAMTARLATPSTIN